MITQEKEVQQLETVFARAYHDYAQGLNTHAFFKVHDHTLGEDLVQDTFIKTWAYLVKGGKIDMMRAFLYHVLKDLIVDEYRKHKTDSLDGMFEKGFEPSIGDPARLANVFDGRKTVLLIAQLPRKYQKVMRMRYVQDLSIKEIALLTKQSRNTVAVQAHRGLAKLKLLYNQHPVNDTQFTSLLSVS